ncbi:MAG: ATP-binding protein [Clostridium sp.]|nr:ATP-binding protein [Clostridium sp.]
MQILNYTLSAYIPFDEESIEKFLFVCEDVINNMTTDEKTIFKLKSATHELLINSLEHGYKKSAGQVRFCMSKMDNTIQLEMSDEGIGFDTSMPIPQEPNIDPDTLNGRGWGLLIIKKLCDSMQISPNVPKGTKVTVLIS